MVTRTLCERLVGKWVQFRTGYGHHRGIIEQVTDDGIVVLAPKHFVPAHLAVDVREDELKRLDVSLAWFGGFGRWGYPGGQGGVIGGDGFKGGYPGFGGGWYWGWSRWTVAFLIIYVLWGLLWW